ncbi:glycoside hydrolase family 3 N-terminal domain-containing protein [Amycolatopsis sp.]|uniref:glycoside hydrolase family 3 N-terminal domain-containing protein n=1 Tax=Amycolatopsis sp. TaxID=37632 RepID=UPI002BCAB0BD|nr:glycoside hydrolase family 3 N-terminal domain-containing protein [Amycolatopsis sp.]HVV07672.1 glycoside hydrolase family 3 N-terminal domain-containing protein [Amycolatopsis sp.]
MNFRTALAFAVTAGLMAGCGAEPAPAGAPSPSSGAPTPAGPSSATSSSAAPSSAAPSSTGGDACAAVTAQMTQREKLAQLLVVGVSPTDPSGAARLVRENQVGGIFIGGNPTTILSGNALDQVRGGARWGVSVAIDEEGGRVQRIDQLDGDMPSARTMAETMTPAQVRDEARRRAQQMRARGVTEDYAPIADVSGQPADGPIGDRSFSADPHTARTYALAFATGLAEGGVTPVLKHFPGHGHAQGDSHDGAVTTPPLDSLRTNDLVPYENVADYGASKVMVGHLTVPGLTGGQPASLSPAAYRLLREDYHFTGAVVTDDLGAMRAITSDHPLPEAVLDALLAGADEALWSSGGKVGAVLDRLEAAMRDGELPGARVDDALGHVLRARHACG